MAIVDGMRARFISFLEKVGNMFIRVHLLGY